MTATIAEEMAKKQRDISVAEFFEKNRHLLGFDNKRKALLTAVKEAVDNALDACEEANILPKINVQINDMNNDRFNVIVEEGEDGYLISEVVELPGCHTQAKTYDELMKRTKEAISLYLSVKKPKPTKSKFLSLQQLEVEAS